MEVQQLERADAGVASAVAPKLVCILGLGRTGTNHLTHVIAHVPEIDSRRELFNPRRCYRMRRDELEELSRVSGVSFRPSNHKRKAIRTIRRHPELVLDVLLRLLKPSKRLLSFKVFVGQLSVRQVRRAILARPDMIVLFLRRRPIDVYVSRVKALKVGTWVSVDTTDMKVDLDPREFVKWWRQAADWYWRLERACWLRGKPFDRLTYEEDVDIPPVEAARRFCALLARHGVGDLTIPPPEAIGGGLRRQDRTDDVRDRVSNWAAFERGLESLGMLDKAFVPFPHFEPRWWHRLGLALRL